MWTAVYKYKYRYVHEKFWNKLHSALSQNISLCTCAAPIENNAEIANCTTQIVKRGLILWIGAFFFGVGEGEMYPPLLD